MSYIAYYRVSTNKQGLSLESQKQQVRQFLGCEPNAEFVEQESGKNDNRPQLREAMAEAEKQGGTLVVAKLDRLSRTASFLHQLADKQVSFKVADLPELNTLTLGIFASLAQYERELISQRTSAVLQDKKRRGEKLGNPENLTYDAKVKGAAANKAKAEANANNIKATGYIVSLRDNENLTWNAIAKKLNNEGFETPKGKAKAFRAETVKRLYNRAKQ